MPIFWPKYYQFCQKMSQNADYAGKSPRKELSSPARNKNLNLEEYIGQGA